MADDPLRDFFESCRIGRGPSPVDHAAAERINARQIGQASFPPVDKGNDARFLIDLARGEEATVEYLSDGHGNIEILSVRRSKR